MNWKRIFTLVAIAGGLAALVTSAATSGRGRIAAPTGDSPQTKATEATGAALAAEIARLRDRLHPTTPPQHPARNLFQFHAAPARRAIPPPSVDEPLSRAAIATPAVPPPLRLIGVAEDTDVNGTGGLARTAIISGFDDLFLVKEGEFVTPRYRVIRIAGDVVELTDVTDSTTIRLALK